MYIALAVMLVVLVVLVVYLYTRTEVFYSELNYRYCVTAQTNSDGTVSVTNAQYTAAAPEQQTWRMNRMNRDGSAITLVSTGNVITAVGTQLVVAPSTGAATQKWLHLKSGEFINVDSGLLFDIVGGNSSNGAPIALYTNAHGGPNQKWFTR